MIYKVAIAQFEPDHNSVENNLHKIGELTKEASKQSVDLLVFGETWLSGYPAWLDHCPEVALWDHEPMKEVYLNFYNNAIQVQGPEYNRLVQICQDSNINLCIGINEKVGTGPGNGTIYNSILTINRKGKLVNHHRKLMPTFSEKLLYGLGDGSGLKSARLDDIHVTGLVCWEHWMPLARQALHNAGEHIHVALWPMLKEMNLVACRQYAFEGRCFVIAVGQMLHAASIPSQLQMKGDLKDTDLLLSGGSCIIAPNGHMISEPVYDDELLIVESLDLDYVIKEQMTLDTSGHYQRPDVFDFRIKSPKD